MKQRDLIHIILENGAVFVRHGSDHDWYKNPHTGKYEAVPRHREIKKQLAQKIIKNLV
ncbi:MAG: type II toxin-antitoxin system HicA family toxin [Treponema sp.]|jgi:predicted RNA binding protein YcfA (HicA-like mRNA interferase family)|nr:type II toxin-antitoxin system HicA family toxin [Treponema sp.]